PLHDIGKIGIPDAVLLKAGRLTREEHTLMKAHTEIGARLLSGSRFPLLRLAQEIARTHHEHWDGSGYLGLRGDGIPLASRIVSVADAFDALTNDRPYRPATSIQLAIEEIRREAGRQFDPAVVDALVRVLESEAGITLGTPLQPPLPGAQ
ncbi:MAG TPA: HD domain-containing phosphohydrolase, partial [Vicinamibacterales bacterium]